MIYLVLSKFNVFTYLWLKETKLDSVNREISSYEEKTLTVLTIPYCPYRSLPVLITDFEDINHVDSSDSYRQVFEGMHRKVSTISWTPVRIFEF